MAHLLEFLWTLSSALLASFHCAGMCGGFVLAAGAGRRLLFSQSLYHVGKTTVYLALGLAAGLGGKTLGTAGAGWGAPQALAVVAGAVLMLTGLHALGWLTFRKPLRLVSLEESPGASPLQGLAALAASHRGALQPVVLGTLSGLLPCPLVYAFLAKAAAGGSLIAASLTMAALGLGTIPILLAVALTGSTLSPLLRHRMVQASGLLLILLGAYTIWRGFAPPPCCVSGGHL